MTIGGAVLLLSLVLVGLGGAAGASANESDEHRSDAATAAQARDANGDHPSENAKKQSDEQDAALGEPQPASNADFSGNGANQSGAYDSTRDGSPSLNGNGGGAAVGKPCAGCVGKADNKNPPGQFPNGSDANKGYECDENSGIGRTNPAHTGCVTNAVVPPTTPETPVDVLGVTFTRPPTAAVLAAVTTPAAIGGTLAATGAGSSLTSLALTGMAMLLVGALLLVSRRRSPVRIEVRS